MLEINLLPDRRPNTRSIGDALLPWILGGVSAARKNPLRWVMVIALTALGLYTPVKWGARGLVMYLIMLATMVGVVAIIGLLQQKKTEEVRRITAEDTHDHHEEEDHTGTPSWILWGVVAAIITLAIMLLMGAWKLVVVVVLLGLGLEGLIGSFRFIQGMPTWFKWVMGALVALFLMGPILFNTIWKENAPPVSFPPPIEEPLRGTGAPW